MDDVTPERESGDSLSSALVAEIEELVERIREVPARIEAGKREDRQRGENVRAQR